MNLSRLQELSGLITPTQVQEADDKIKPATGDFHSILDFVNDSLADLNDALGAGGTLSKLSNGSKASAISKLFADFKKEVEAKLTDIEVDLMASEADVNEDTPAATAKQPVDLQKPIWVIRTNNGQKQQLKAHLHSSDEVGDTVSIDDTPDRKIVIKKTVQGPGKMYQITDRKINEAKRINEAKDYSDSGEFTDDLFSVSDHISKIKQSVRQPRWTNWMQVTDDNFSTSSVALNKDFVEKLKELDTAFDALENELHSAS